MKERIASASTLGAMMRQDQKQRTHQHCQLSTASLLVMAVVLILSKCAVVVVEAKVFKNRIHCPTTTTTSPKPTRQNVSSSSNISVKRNDNDCNEPALTKTTTTTTTTTTSEQQQRELRRRWGWGTRIERLIDKAYYDSDVDHDGTISFQEAYEGVLRMYITLNRQARIDPPPRYRVLQMYLEADVTRTGRLDRGEFGSLAKRVSRRAVLRVGANKMVTIVGAPALAEAFVRVMSRYRVTIEAMFRFLIPNRFHDYVLPTPLLSPAFHRSIWTIIFVATLGNFCLSFVNFILDLSLPGENEEEAIKQLEQRRGK